jgi:hypothetical protein
MSIDMQGWRALIKPRDRTLMDEALEDVRRLHARTKNSK